MKCHIQNCQNEASHQCADCHKPMCDEHSKRVNTWLTEKVEIVCTACAPLYWWSEPPYEVRALSSDI